MLLLTLIGIGLVIGVAVWEGNRGIVRPMFDAAGALIGVKVASHFGPSIAATSAGNVQAFWTAALFLAVTGLGVLAGYYFDDILAWSVDTFDGLIGGAFGLIVGISLGHILIKGLLLTYHGSPVHDQIMRSFIAQELYQFRAWHAFLNGMRHLGQS